MQACTAEGQEDRAEEAALDDPVPSVKCGVYIRRHHLSVIRNITGGSRLLSQICISGWSRLTANQPENIAGSPDTLNVLYPRSPGFSVVVPDVASALPPPVL